MARLHLGFVSDSEPNQSAHKSQKLAQIKLHRGLYSRENQRSF